MQAPDLNEQRDDIYLSNEEILSYVCGHNLRYCDSRQTNENMESKKLSKAEEGLLVPSNRSMTNSDTTKLILKLDKKPMSEHDISVFYDHGSCQNIQTMENNTEGDHVLSAVASQNKPYVTLNANTKLSPDHDKVCMLHNTTCSHCYSKHCGSNMLPIVEQVNHDNLAEQEEKFSQQKEANRAMSHKCNNERAINMDANSDQLSLDSSGKHTEETLTSSVSSYSINTSLAEGDYIENRSPMHSTIVSCITMQSPNFHQNNVKHFDDNTCSITTAIEGEYVDRNIAVQQNKHTTYKN